MKYFKLLFWAIQFYKDLIISQRKYKRIPISLFIMTMIWRIPFNISVPTKYFVELWFDYYKCWPHIITFGMEDRSSETISTRSVNQSEAIDICNIILSIFILELENLFCQFVSIYNFWINIKVFETFFHSEKSCWCNNQIDNFICVLDIVYLFGR